MIFSQWNHYLLWPTNLYFVLCDVIWCILLGQSSCSRCMLQSLIMFLLNKKFKSIRMDLPFQNIFSGDPLLLVFRILIFLLSSYFVFWLTYVLIKRVCLYIPHPKYFVCQNWSTLVNTENFGTLDLLKINTSRW